MDDVLFSTLELLYRNMKVRVPLIRARPTFHKTSGNPNFSLRIVDLSFHTRCTVLKDGYQKKKMDMFACLAILANILYFRARQNQFFQEEIFDNALIRRIVIGMNSNSAFTGPHNENSICYQ